MDSRSSRPEKNLYARSRMSMLSTALVLMPLTAAAQAGPNDGNRAAARQLGEQGIMAYWADDFASADAKLEQAFQLFPTPTLALWSARARKRLGQLVEAAERYREAVRASAELGDSAAQRRAQLDAQAELDALIPRIPSITLAIEAADQTSVRVSLDGSPLPSDSVGTARPTNPGMHRLKAVRGEDRYEQPLELVEGQHVSASIHFRAAAPAAEPTASDLVPVTPEALPMTPAAHVEPPPSAAGVPVAADPSQQSSTEALLRPIAYVAMAAGAASLLGAGVVALVANTNRTADCPDYRCTSDEAMQSYDSLRTASTVAFYVGAALVVGGFVTWVVVPSAQQARESRVRWDVGPGGIKISGAF